MPDDLVIQILAQINRADFDKFCEVFPPIESKLKDIIDIVNILDYE